MPQYSSEYKEPAKSELECYNGKYTLKKTDPFLLMLKLWMLILVLTRFLKKLNFSWGAKIWEGQWPPCFIVNYTLADSLFYQK